LNMTSPEGTGEIGELDIPNGFQPSLTGLLVRHAVPRTASWAEVRRPFGT
jgi:hypothetical protein